MMEAFVARWCADWDPQAERQRVSTRVVVLHDYTAPKELHVRAEHAAEIAHKAMSLLTLFAS